ncbi:hypothetical protein [Modestobacter sp. NPDC049651]|uniref:hypothetical protein n=1 Tax=unclassified Modestobacter TaxID=2643866 RepID=UPI00340C9CCC
MSAHAATGETPTRTVVHHLLTHLIVPVLLATGMALAYLGGFHQPQPHGVRLDVVGTGPAVATLAQGLQDSLGDAAAVRTVPDVDAARDALAHLDVAGAYVPDPTSPELLIASAGSDTTATIVEKMLSPVALEQGLPLRITDVVPTAATDPTGQGAFFYLVALSVGGYSSAIAIGAAGARLRMRHRLAFGVGVAALISAIATVVAGPLYGALPSGALAIGFLSWLYVTAVVWIGVGLHSLIGRWTTLAVTALFVMLNFTSAGGVFAPEVQPGFFSALHSFWIGSGLVEAARRITYFPALGIGGQVLTIALWAVAGLALAAVAGLTEQRRRAAATTRAADAVAPAAAATAAAPAPVVREEQVDAGAAETEAEEEIEETVAV